MSSTSAMTKLREAPALRYLDPHQVKVYRNQELGGRICATIADEVTLLEPRFLRAHPLSDPDRYIALRETDPGWGKEHGLLRNWQRLDPESRALVQAELDRRYLHPVLLSISWVKDYGGVAVAEIETDRGTREVTLRDIRDNVIYLPGGRVLITDAEGNRYDLPDSAKLDPRSAQLLAKIL